MWERGVSGGDIAKALDVNDSAISRWKNGKATPGLDSVFKLAKYFDVPGVALAVTAGLMTEGEAGTARLPLPEKNRSVELAEQHILDRIPGLSDEDREALLNTLHERYPNR